jgi:hypothetical protein
MKQERRTANKNNAMDMKNFMKNGLLALLLGLGLAGCKRDVPEIGPRLSVAEGFVGKWELSTASLTDLLTPVPETKDVSRFYKNATTKWVVDFDADGNFSVVETGPGPDVFNGGGTYELLDRVDFPTMIRLNYTAGGSATFNLLNMPRSVDTNLGLRLTKEACGAPYMAYNFGFIRQ